MLLKTLKQGSMASGRQKAFTETVNFAIAIWDTKDTCVSPSSSNK